MKTNNVKIITNVLQEADQNTWIVFDVDDVLIQPQDQILRSPYRKTCENFEKIIDSRFTNHEASRLYSLIWLQRKIKPVHKCFISLISRLQKKGIKVLALTNCITGKFGYIDSVVDWRIQELKNLGYHLDKSWIGLSEIIFGQFQLRESEKFPMYKSGIIFTHGVSKGEILKEFLNYVPTIPKKIIFIDDLASNLKSVRKITYELGIDFAGIEYTTVRETEIEPVNFARANLQFEILMKKNKWFSDYQIKNCEK